MSQQELPQTMTCLELIFLCRFARSDQIAERFVRCVWYPHRRQLPGAMATRQFLGIAAIGFDPVTRLLWDQTRCDHLTLHPELRELPVKNVTGWAGLVTDLQVLCRTELCDQLANRFQPIRNGAVRVNFSICIGNCNAMVSAWTSRPTKRTLDIATDPFVCGSAPLVFRLTA